MKTNITFEIDSDRLDGYTDEYLAELWYIAQANGAGIADRDAGDIAEHIGREIIRRWIRETPVPLWNHQGRHAPQIELADMRDRIQSSTRETQEAQ